MKLDTALIEAVCDPNGLFGNKLFGPASRPYVSWLNGKSLKAEVLEELSGWSFKDEGYAGSLRLDGEHDLMFVNDRFPELLAERLLAVGSCPNGDMVVIDVESPTGAAGFVAHDQIDIRPLRSVFIPLEVRLGSLLEASDASADFPSDYYSAHDRLEAADD